VESIVKETHIFGMASEWTYLQSYLKIFVAKVFPEHISCIYKLNLLIVFNNFEATVTYLSKNLNKGLFIFYSLLYSFEIDLGNIFKKFVTFSLTYDSHFSWLLFFYSFFFSKVTSSSLTSCNLWSSVITRAACELFNIFYTFGGKPLQVGF